jgi:hypothetical protein
MDLEKLREDIEREIENYRYPYTGMEVGGPKSSDWIAGQLDQMRAALVTPYWITVEGVSYAIVADDVKRHFLAYNTQMEEFLLLEKSGDRLIDMVLTVSFVISPGEPGFVAAVIPEKR